MKRNKKLLFFSLGMFLCIFPTVNTLVNKKKSGFTLKKIQSPFQANAKWAMDSLPEIEKVNLYEVLSQDFNYFGSGAECYAFLSSDGNYVLKFFKIKRLLPKNWLKLIPLPGLGKYRFNKIDKKILRHHELFSSYKMAFEELKKETGLIYIHLNKTKDLRLKVRIYDRMRKCFLVDLDRYEFVVQKKGQLVQDKITAFMQKGNREGALEAIHNLLKQVVVQCQRGFIDRDSGINHNYGFIDDQVIHFDVGRIMRDESAQEPAYYQQEVLRVGKKLENWLSIQYPALLPDLEEAIYAIIDPGLQK